MALTTHVFIFCGQVAAPTKRPSSCGFTHWGRNHFVWKKSSPGSKVYKFPLHVKTSLSFRYICRNQESRIFECKAVISDLVSREVDSFQWTADVMEEENGRKRVTLLMFSIIILIQILTLYLIIDLQHKLYIDTNMYMFTIAYVYLQYILYTSKKLVAQWRGPCAVAETCRSSE